MTSVCVVGAGLSGLVAARALAGGAEVVVLEAGPRPGGKLRTVEFAGTRVDVGADSFLARDPVVAELCRSLGLQDELVAPAVFGAQVWLERGLRRIPHGFPYGLPSSPLAAWRHGVLTAPQALRAAAEVLLPRTRGEQTVGGLVRRRFGRAVLDNLVDPLMAGTRAGTVDDLELASALPAVAALASRERSLLMGLRRAARRRDPLTGPPPFLGLRGGMERLAETLARTCGELRTSAPATALRRRGGRWVVAHAGGEVVCDGVVLAVPAPVAARLLEEASPAAAACLAAVRYADVATVALRYPPGALPAPPGVSGLLVPSGRGRVLAAATYYDRKWPHLAPPDGSALVKAFAGRAAGGRILGLSDEDLAARLASDLADALEVRAEPSGHLVVRWPGGIPQFERGHAARVAAARAHLPPGVALCGAYVSGSGLPDCARSALDAAGFLAGRQESQAARRK